MKIIILFLIAPILTVGQTTYNGSITNKKTKEKIPFATVGLIKENIGINATEDGDFILVSKNDKLNDTLIFSCVGYETLKHPIDKNNLRNLSIELEEKVNELSEVVITNKTSWTFNTLNDFSKCGNSFVGSSGYQTQLAQHFQVPAANAILTALKICRMSLGLIDPEKTIFRIRIYDMNTLTKAPSNDLCDQVIEVKTRSKTISLNLQKYKIHIPNKDFFVAIEWLKIPYNESKGKTKLPDGKVIETISYRPSIGWTDNISSKMDPWMLDYKNIWRPMFKMNGKTSVSISATVKY
ncbi:MAG: carboxypeptidase-like regulatory domain-containing protein [Chitinophagaceae bacterium]